MSRKKENPLIETKVQLFDTLHKLPYQVFKTIMVEGNLSLLVISGNPGTDKLAEIWEGLLEAYAEAFANNSNEDRLYWSTYKSYIHHLQKQTFGRLLIESLSICYNPEWSKILYNSLLIANQWERLNPNNVEEYQKELNRLFNRTKDVYIHIYGSRLEAIKNKRGESNTKQDSTPTYEKFITIETNLDLHFKQQFDYDKMSTGKFVELVKRYNKVVEEIKQRSKK